MYNPQSKRYEHGWRPDNDPFQDADGMPIDPGLIEGEGEGRWKDVINTRTGEHSVKEHKLKVVKQWCKPSDHSWIEINPTTHDIECQICGHEDRYVLGMCRLVDGKLIRMTPGE